MLSKIFLLLGTVIHLRWKQIHFQLYYKLRAKLKKPQSFANLKGYVEPKEGLKLIDFEFLAPSTSIKVVDDMVKFTFLNSQEDFSLSKIPWNYVLRGKLWNYNLNYFDYLFAKNLECSEGIALIRQYCLAFPGLKDGLEPYPISLRGINWIKYLSKTVTRDSNIDKALYRQYQVLCANLEYHILANHLLENAFSLLFAAYYFQNERYYNKASKLLLEELNEQILEDGAHYERSPMYHQIILYRLLDSINMVSNSAWKSQELLQMLKAKAGSMFAWLEEMTLPGLQIPWVKDAAPGIAPNTAQLSAYGQKLGMKWSEKVKLSTSGYRKLSGKRLSMILDVGEVQPTYQPAHAHADELNFLLFSDENPIIVDTGTSTYDKNERRQLERSTSSHNCVFLPDQNSSRVWGGFRVARRAKVDLQKDSSDLVVASHNGFAKQGVEVTRSFQKLNDGFVIENLIESQELKQAQLNLHFHPDVTLNWYENEIIANDVRLTLSGFGEVIKENYMFACGFNKLQEAQRLCLKLNSKAKILIDHVN